MVRIKQIEPAKNSIQAEMAFDMCKLCDLVVNRKGENRPAVRCKDCKEKHCFQCASMEVMLCQMMRDAGKDFWVCGSCETKNSDLKSVVESIHTIQTEISTIKKGQSDQQKETEKVLESLKVMETVVKKIENIEGVQANHEDRLTAQECAKGKSDEKLEAGLRRLEEVEKKLGQLEDEPPRNRTNDGTLDVRLTNAVVREVREIEKREKNFMVWNIPESTEESEDREKYDETKVKDVLKELGMESIPLGNVARMGDKGGRYPRKIRVIVNTTEDCKKIIKAGESNRLPDNVRLSRDRTFHERQEARLFREEKEEEQREPPMAAAVQRGGGRGGGGRGGGRCGS